MAFKMWIVDKIERKLSKDKSKQEYPFGFVRK